MKNKPPFKPDNEIKNKCCDELRLNTYNFGQIYAIIPAAGKGSRYGEPKVTATYGEKTFIKHILDSLTETPIAGVKVVRDIETADMLASIKLGIECALKDDWDALGWLIWPVDHPLVKPATVVTLVRHFWQSPDSIVCPVYSGRRGHPIIIPVNLEICTNNEKEGLRTVIANSDVPRIEVEVSDPTVVRNINHKEDKLPDV